MSDTLIVNNSDFNRILEKPRGNSNRGYRTPGSPPDGGEKRAVIDDI